MKILVCTDGSGQSDKVLKTAARFADGKVIEEVIIIYVYDGSFTPGVETPSALKEDFKKWQEESRKKGEEILSEASKFFEDKNVNTRTVYEKGHPSSKIINAAQEEEVDMIFIGSRGMSGLKKVFLGSVSNAVVQEATNCSVTVVK